MKHPHADMIIAKAENMDLVLLCKIDNKTWCEATVRPLIPWCDETEYFLCLPQHKEACLHWINGGDAQCKPNLSPAKGFEYDWDQLPDSEDLEWSKDCVWMSENAIIRIKPRKEKRHIYISTLGATTYAKKTKEDAAREVSIMGGSFDVWKHYEVEVEV